MACVQASHPRDLLMLQYQFFGVNIIPTSQPQEVYATALIP